MVKEKIAEVIKERIRICEETQDNWGDGIEQCWKKYTEIITGDIEKAIAYFLHECTDEEFYWLSEAFEEISEKAHSMDLIAAWHSRLAIGSLENYNQQGFRTEFMRKHITYEEYVKDINSSICDAEDRIGESTDFTR